MPELALIGINNSHPYVFGGYINGGDRETFERNSPAWTHKLFPERDWEPVVGGGDWKFTTAWSRLPDFAREVMDAVRVPNLAVSVEQAAESTDGAFVCDMWGGYHAEQALPFLERGKPVFVDKPLAETVADARKMIETAQASGAVLSTCSAMRFDRKMIELRRELEDGLGRPKIVTVTGPCYQDLARYSVHTIEMMLEVVQRPPVRRLRNISHGVRRHTLHLEFHNGAYGVIHSWEDHAYSVTVTAERGQRVIELADPDCHRTMVERVLESFANNRPIVDYGNALEVVRVIEAGNLSRENGGAPVLISAEPTLAAGERCYE